MTRVFDYSSGNKINGDFERRTVPVIMHYFSRKEIIEFRYANLLQEPGEANNLSLLFIVSTCNQSAMIIWNRHITSHYIHLYPMKLPIVHAECHSQALTIGEAMLVKIASWVLCTATPTHPKKANMEGNLKDQNPFQREPLSLPWLQEVNDYIYIYKHVMVFLFFIIFNPDTRTCFLLVEQPKIMPYGFFTIRNMNWYIYITLNSNTYIYIFILIIKQRKEI